MDLEPELDTRSGDGNHDTSFFCQGQTAAGRLHFGKLLFLRAEESRRCKQLCPAYYLPIRIVYLY